MLFLRLDQALQLERVARDLRERLVIRYELFNGLSRQEVRQARIEHLDPVECVLFLPKRHWKRNCVCHIDPETARLQIVYSDGRKKGPLIRSDVGGHCSAVCLHRIVKRVAARTDIPEKERISQLVLKRTFAREWLLAGGTIGSLQKQFSHRWLWSTAMYLRFIMDDVKQDHAQLMRRVEVGQETESVRLVQ
jgi:integrase